MDEMNADDKKVCCDAVNEKEDVMSYLLKQGIDISSRSECFCPLGELLRYGVATESLEAVIQLSSICTGSSSQDDGIIDGLYVALQSIFSPRCPDIKAAMEQMLSQKMNPAADAPAPSEPSLEADASTPESSLIVESVSASATWLDGPIKMLPTMLLILSV
jgi:hypothetical protein